MNKILFKYEMKFNLIQMMSCNKNYAIILQKNFYEFILATIWKVQQNFSRIFRSIQFRSNLNQSKSIDQIH